LTENVIIDNVLHVVSRTETRKKKERKQPPQSAGIGQIVAVKR